MKYCDMSEQDALNMVTINPAIQLKIDDKVGSVTVGKQADFVLWSDHPLSIYAKAQQTYIAGVKYFDRKQDVALQSDILREKQQLVQKVLVAPDFLKKGSGGEMKKPEPIWHCEDNGDYLRGMFGHHHHNHHHQH